MDGIPSLRTPSERRLEVGPIRDLQGFGAWLSGVVGREEPEPQTLITDIVNGDLGFVELTLALDLLVGEEGIVDRIVYECQTVRDLFVYYLVIMSRPLESSDVRG